MDLQLKQHLDKLGRDKKGLFNKYNKAACKEGVKEFDVVVKFYISKDQLVRLNKKCGKGSRSELIRTYVEWGLEND